MRRTRAIVQAGGLDREDAHQGVTGVAFDCDWPNQLPWRSSKKLLAELGGARWAPTVSWWWIAAGWVLLLSPAGRIAVSAARSRGC